MSRFAPTVLISLVLVFAACTRVTHVHTGGEAPDTLVALGTGTAEVLPEVARLAFVVDARGPIADQVLAEAQRRATAVASALKTRGVPDQDVRVGGPQLNRVDGAAGCMVPGVLPALPPSPVPPLAAPDAPPLQPNYVATVTVATRVKDLGKIGALTETALRAGASQSLGVFYELEDSTAAYDTARAQAVDNAKHQAEDLAQRSGVRLGRLLSVAEVPRQTLNPFMDEDEPGYFAPPRSPHQEGVVYRTRRVRATYEIIR